MNKILAKCTVCNYIFPSLINSMFPPNATFVNLGLKNNSESCPVCNGSAKVLDGNFSTNTQGVLEVISGPTTTKKAYEQFIQLLYRAEKDNLSTEDFVKETQKISPDLANRIKKYLPNDANSLYAFLNIIVTLLTGIKSDEKPSVTNITNHYYNQKTYIQQPYIIPKSYSKNNNQDYKTLFPSQPQKDEPVKNELVNKSNVVKVKSNKKPAQKSISTKSIEVKKDTSSSTKNIVKKLLNKGK